MNQRRTIALFFLCLALISAALADDFWVKKPFSKWSKNEAEKMLTESPWSHSVTLSSITMMGVGRATGPVGGAPTSGIPSITPGSTGADTGRQSTPQITYNAQLRSAKPVRQAVVRQLQFQAKYDSLNDQQKAALDERTNSYLNAPQENIVIYVRFDSNTPNYLAEVRRYWVQQNAELLRNSVFLSVSGQRLSPVAYVASDEAFQFTFARPAEVPANGSAVLEFVHPTIGTIKTERVVMDFKLNKMISDGVPAI